MKCHLNAFQGCLGLSLRVRMKDVPWVAPAALPGLLHQSSARSSLYFVCCVTPVTPSLSPGRWLLGLLATTPKRGNSGKWPITESVQLYKTLFCYLDLDEILHLLFSSCRHGLMINLHNVTSLSPSMLLVRWFSRSRLSAIIVSLLAAGEAFYTVWRPLSSRQGPRDCCHQS